ncbi:MAG: hypothetical protein KAR42_13735 [candidate division Zixibacteria bacterium]|nr:hypothetical protein [candidate division Zixibacteria bacterium]
MFNKYTDWQNWILQNLQLLTKMYGKNNVVLNGKNWQSILIINYPLPSSWKQRATMLLIILPKKSHVFYTAPDRFYIDKGLKTITGKTPGHYFEDDDFNDMSKNNMARFSFHLKTGWKPKIHCNAGTNLSHVIYGLGKGMDKAAREVM